VGGRTHTVNAWDDPEHPIELGASIFVSVNEILVNATKEFGLDEAALADEDDVQLMGIWNGQTFVYTQNANSWDWWNNAKMLWKYGMSPIRTRNLMRSTVGTFLKLYTPEFFPFRSLSRRAADLGLIASTGVTGEQLLEANSIYAPFSTDIIQASTRVNYGANLNLIHGLETMVCMAIDGAMQVKGGNWQIFSNMVERSNATLELNSEVQSITKTEKGFDLEVVGTRGATTNGYDKVIIATPYQFSKLSTSPTDLLDTLPDDIPYVTIHVTLFATPLKLKGAYFGLAPDQQMPDTVLTTIPPGDKPAAKPDPETQAGRPGFFSISTLRSVTNPSTGEKQYIYKIFSPSSVKPEFLRAIFNSSTIVPEGISEGDLQGRTSSQVSKELTWYYPYVWKSYPYELPRVTFEEIELARGVWYTAGIESFISTMETSALMGKNVARLVVDEYLRIMRTETGYPSKGAEFRGEDL
jgi:prenylcysteine oxidase/farnesylcysteine lyase